MSGADHIVDNNEKVREIAADLDNKILTTAQ